MLQDVVAEVLLVLDADIAGCCRLVAQVLPLNVKGGGTPWDLHKVECWGEATLQ